MIQDIETDRGLLLYCAFRPGEPLELPEGVEVIASDTLAIAAREIEDVATLQQPDREQLVDFQETVARVFAQRTVVPFRWGSIARTRHDLEEMLHSDSALWRDQLEQLDGHVEMGIRVWVNPPAPQKRTDAAQKKPRSGADYLRARKANYDAEAPFDVRHPAVTQLLEPLGQTFREVDVSHSHKNTELFGGTTVSVALLVPRDGVERFLAAYESGQPYPIGERVEVSGPWPPYSFV